MLLFQQLVICDNEQEGKKLDLPEDDGKFTIKVMQLLPMNEKELTTFLFFR